MWICVSSCVLWQLRAELAESKHESDVLRQMLEKVTSECDKLTEGMFQRTRDAGVNK